LVLDTEIEVTTTKNSFATIEEAISTRPEIKFKVSNIVKKHKLVLYIITICSLSYKLLESV